MGFGRRALLAALLGVALSACSVSEIAVDTVAGFLGDAAPRGYFDYETAGQAGANTILQFEAMFTVSPENEQIRLTLAKAYEIYAFGWVMDQSEQALVKYDYEQADRHQHRAHIMYKRANNLVLSIMRERDAGIDAALEGDPGELMAYLKKHYPDPEDDVELIFWCALTFGSTVTSSPDMTDLMEIPAVRVVARYASMLNASYESAGAMALLAGIDGSYPEEGGGDWARSKRLFERAIELSEGKSHLHHVNFARTYAITAQDRELFVKLLHEVIDAPDQGDAMRLSNKVARRRAERYLKHIDYWFE